jgi:hypothetical protein
MTHSPSTTSLGLAYNPFLFASFGEALAAGPISTVSALARLDIDPWQEAAELTRLPKGVAIQRLALLLARLPGWSDAIPDSQMAATRLIGLLPGQAGEVGEVGAVSRQPNELRAAASPTFVAIGFGIALIVLVTGFLAAPNDRAPEQATAKPASASSTAQPGAAQTNPRR